MSLSKKKKKVIIKKIIIGDMTYVREVTKLTCIVVCVYISSLTQFAYFLSLFELVGFYLVSNSMLSRHRFCCYMCLPNALPRYS